MKTVGIIGGMGPLATADLFRRIICKTDAHTDQGHLHVLIDSNSDIPDRTKSIVSNGDSPLVELIKSAKRLETAGADFLIMGCNTAHYYYRDICKAINIPFLNIIEETVNYIEKTYGNNIVVGLLATDGTISTGIYDAYFQKANIKLITPVLTQKNVMEFIYEGIKKGNYSFNKKSFFEAVEELRVHGAEVILLGCTELSSAKDLFHFDDDFIDPLDIIAEKAIQFAGGKVVRYKAE